MSSEPGNESFFCGLRPIPRILRLQDEITRVKRQVATCAGCESIWHPLRLSTNRLRPVATPVGTPEHFRIGFAATENDLRPLPRIRSLAYFQPVIEELQDHPVPDGYLDYLRLKLRGLMDKAGPAKVQKSTFSDDR